MAGDTRSAEGLEHGSALTAWGHFSPMKIPQIWEVEGTERGRARTALCLCRWGKEAQRGKGNSSESYSGSVEEQAFVSLVCSLQPSHSRLSYSAKGSASQKALPGSPRSHCHSPQLMLLVLTLKDYALIQHLSVCPSIYPSIHPSILPSCKKQSFCLCLRHFLLLAIQR